MIGLFGFLKKKPEELPMPPPPSPEELVPEIRGDIEEIRVPEEMPLALPEPLVTELPTEEVPKPSEILRELPAGEKEVVFDKN